MQVRLVRKLPMPLPENFIGVNCIGFGMNRTRGKRIMDGTSVGLAIPRLRAEIGLGMRWTTCSECADLPPVNAELLNQGSSHRNSDVSLELGAPHYVRSVAMGLSAFVVAAHLWSWISMSSFYLGGHSDFRQLSAAAYMVLPA